jgi:hypothetical protein
MMAYNTQNYRVFGLCPLSRILRKWRTQSFRNWICFHLQVRGETPTLLGPLERANINHLFLPWFLVNLSVIYYCCSQTPELLLTYFQKIQYLYTTILSCILMMRHDDILKISMCFTLRSTFLLASNRISVFLYRIYVSSSQIHIISTYQKIGRASCRERV